MAPSVPKASRTRRNIGRGYGPKVNHHGEPGIGRKFNDLRHLWPAPRRPYGILARHRTGVERGRSSQFDASRIEKRITSSPFWRPDAKNPREVVAGLVSTAPAVHSRGRKMAPRADVSERGGPGLPGAGNRTAADET